MESWNALKEMFMPYRFVDLIAALKSIPSLFTILLFHCHLINLLLCFFYSIVNTFRASASQLLLHHDIYCHVHVCAHVCSYTLQCHFAMCWFCHPFKVQEDLIGLANAFEAGLHYKLTAGPRTGLSQVPTLCPVICFLGGVSWYKAYG